MPSVDLRGRLLTARLHALQWVDSILVQVGAPRFDLPLRIEAAEESVDTYHAKKLEEEANRASLELARCENELDKVWSARRRRGGRKRNPTTVHLCSDWGCSCDEAMWARPKL